MQRPPLVCSRALMVPKAGEQSTMAFPPSQVVLKIFPSMLASVRWQLILVIRASSMHRSMTPLVAEAYSRAPTAAQVGARFSTASAWLLFWLHLRLILLTRIQFTRAVILTTTAVLY